MKFGFEQVNGETPAFAVWIFRGYVVISSAAASWISGTSFISEHGKTESLLLITCLTPIVLFVSKMFGVDAEQKPENDGSQSNP